MKKLILEVTRATREVMPKLNRHRGGVLSLCDSLVLIFSVSTTLSIARIIRLSRELKIMIPLQIAAAPA